MAGFASSKLQENAKLSCAPCEDYLEHIKCLQWVCQSGDSEIDTDLKSQWCFGQKALLKDLSWTKHEERIILQITVQIQRHIQFPSLL